MKKFLCNFAISALILTSMTNSFTVEAQSSTVEARIKQLHQLLDEHWEYTMKKNPEYASILGDKRYNDKLTDFSQEAIDKDLEQEKLFLKKFEAIDSTGFPEQELLNKDLMVLNLKEIVDGIKFKNWEMPVNQMNGLHIDAPQLTAMLSFDTVKDYVDYIARLEQLPVAFDQTIVQMRNGMKDGLMPPKFLLDQVGDQTEKLAKQKPEESPFAVIAIQKLPKSFSDADKKRLTNGIIAALKDQVLPAYNKFLTFIRNEYAPKGRTEIAISSLPNGKERYEFAVKNSTTTNMTPEEIHQLGLREVARIEAEELKIAQKLGFKDLKSFKESLEKNPELHPKSRQQIINEYKKYTAQMYAKLPELFGRLPKAKVEIFPVEEFREKEAPGAQYNPGALDGSRPGHVYVNTYDYAKQLTITNESTAYHEGVPGHHMQISIAQELPNLPKFRGQAGYTAYVEGWALYTEGLGKEVGFYQNPYSEYGHYEDEIWRAIRLVVDTGIHYKKWTRDQVVQFMRDHSSAAEANIQAETNRYITWPSQALAYKIGQLTIIRLREKAQKQIGSKFDVRAFHDEVLGAGALPLNILEQRINAWMSQF